MLRYTFFATQAQHLPAIIAWGEQLMGERREEALVTLTEEKLEHESMYLIQGSDPPLILAISEGGHLPSNPSRSINQEHYRMLALLTPAESILPKGELTILYKLSI
jgi:hypothetical protein